jgi:hypothetical protein
VKKLLPFLFLFAGCSSFNYKIVGWYNIAAPDPSSTVLLSNGKKAIIVGNPRIFCFDKYGNKVADGIFVKIQDGFLEVDEFGKRYDYIPNSENYYCTLWEQEK